MILLTVFLYLFLEYVKKIQNQNERKQFIFESVDLLYYILHKISLNRGGSYIDSPNWIKTKKATINPKTKDNECFKYAIIAALNHENIGKDPQRISKLKPFINNYNWKDIEFPSNAKDYKKFEKNNNTIALNILYAPFNTRQIRPSYISKHNHKRDNLLMITSNSKNRHYLAIKGISKLLRRITSNHNGGFYCLYCLHVDRAKKNLESIKEYAKIMISAT